MNYRSNIPDELKRILSPSGRFEFETFEEPPAGHCLYVIWTESCMFYIGSTSSFQSRMNQHERALERGRGNYLMQKQWDLTWNMKVTVIASFSNRMEAYAAEQRMLDNTSNMIRAGRMNVNPLATGLGEGSENPGATPVTIVTSHDERIQCDTTTQAADVLDCSQSTVMNMMDGRLPLWPGIQRIFRTFGRTSAPNTGRPTKPVVATTYAGETSVYASLTAASQDLGISYSRLGSTVRAGRTIDGFKSISYLGTSS